MDLFTKEGITEVMGIPQPPALIKVQYGDIEVQPGQEVTPTQVKDQPVVSWPIEEEATYVLFMQDLDAPSRAEPTSREFAHWLITNITGTNIFRAEILREYIGSGPPLDTGLHRYVFLVYKQPKPVVFYTAVPFLSDVDIEGRRGTKVTDIVEKYGLIGPVAGNFYQAQYDDYVPILHASFSRDKYAELDDSD